MPMGLRLPGIVVYPDCGTTAIGGMALTNSGEVYSCTENGLTEYGISRHLSGPLVRFALGRECPIFTVRRNPDQLLVLASYAS